MTSRLFCLALLMSFAVGCGAEKRAYDVSVTNNLAKPVTVWVTKDGPPAEDGWQTPEEIAYSNPGKDDTHLAAVVQPGQVAKVTLEGRFSSRTHAWLRVYLGKPGLSEMLAMSRGSLSRADTRLEPGENKIVVDDQLAELRATRLDTPPAAPVK